MDLSKAFDKVPHSRLNWKVKLHGTHGELANWIRNWLNGRKQRVKVEGCFSDWRPVSSGGPQGLMLGPLLFVIFRNDLDVNVQGLVSKCADESKLGGIIDSEEGYQELQGDLDQLGKWAENWQLEFNTDKCEVLHFGKSNQGRTCTVNGRVLESVEEQRDRGVQVHSSLKAASQVDRVVKKVFNTLAFISQGIEYRSWDIMLQLYKSLVRPHLEYCVQVWSPCYIGKTLINWKECRQD